MSAPGQAGAAWSIGVLVGRSPLRLAPPAGIANPVLTAAAVTDRAADIVADPFVLREGPDWHLFFEVWSARAARGAIGHATSRDGAAWTYRGIVLAEPFHLSYPYVFRHEGQVYLVPESVEDQSVRLYRADPFPERWSLVTTLLAGGYFADSSLFRHAGRWWMFTDASAERRHDTLRLYFAARPEGPWREHPASPVRRGDPHAARPGGRVLASDAGIIRYAQDDDPTYGLAVRAFQVLELSTAAYRERPLLPDPVVRASGAGWNALGMHHIDALRLAPGRWIAFVDGLGPPPDLPD